MSTPKDPKPNRVAGVDITKLNLDTTDGFIWSLVDSGHSLHELALITALDREEIVVRLHKLARLGVIQWESGAHAEPVSLLPPPNAHGQVQGTLKRPGTSFDSVPTGLFEPPKRK